MNALTKLSADAIQQLAADALKRMSPITFWLKKNVKRDGHPNDADYTGQLEFSTLHMAELLAGALERGDAKVRVFVNMRNKIDGKACFTGWAGKLVESRDAE